MLVLLGLMVTSGTVLGFSDTPLHTFEPGTLISASRVNANFAALFAEVYALEQSVNAGVLQGEKGDKGASGDQGLKGLQGDKGDPGPEYTRGEKEPETLTGDIIQDSTIETWVKYPLVENGYKFD